MTEYTSIRVDAKIRDRLKDFGKKGETYDDILVRLMESYDEGNNKK